MTKSLSFSVRADLFRVAQAFTETRDPRYCGVRVEPLPQGGVVLIGWNGADLIALDDQSGHIERAASIYVGKALTNMAVDLFRRTGEYVRLNGSDGIAFISPDDKGQAVRDFERQCDYPDWRAVLQQHCLARLDPPIAFGARVARKIADAAIGLAKAADSEAEVFLQRGGINATVVTFPAWPTAVAICAHTLDVETARAENQSTLWHPPAWLHSGRRLAVVQP